MTIALVIPVFNEQEILARFLNGIFPLKFDEVIVVDGGSRDRTVEIARSLLDKSGVGRTQLLTTVQGRAVQMNAGAGQARAEILVFLHADTVLPDHARRLIETAMLDHSCVGGRFDVRFPQDRGWAWIISRMMNLRSRRTGICTGDQTIFVRREIFTRLGGFADIPLMEDLEFTARLKKMGHIAALPDKVTTSFRRWERHGPFRTVLRMWTLRFLYWIGLNPCRLVKFYEPVR